MTLYSEGRGGKTNNKCGAWIRFTVVVERLQTRGRSETPGFLQTPIITCSLRSPSSLGLHRYCWFIHTGKVAVGFNCCITLGRSVRVMVVSRH